ncbi:hypothetical protein [Pedobacter sp. CFBP9032]|nr:hypothetical protein [Pedobacter sp. CFBP9032]MDY0907094.1 hypothetical protein [Pedobacter sp. CFBP9032]
MEAWGIKNFEIDTASDRLVDFEKNAAPVFSLKIKKFELKCVM